MGRAGTAGKQDASGVGGALHHWHAEAGCIGALARRALRTVVCCLGCVGRWRGRPAAATECAGKSLTLRQLLVASNPASSQPATHLAHPAPPLPSQATRCSCTARAMRRRGPTSCSSTRRRRPATGSSRSASWAWRRPRTRVRVRQGGVVQSVRTCVRLCLCVWLAGMHALCLCLLGWERQWLGGTRCSA